MSAKRKHRSTREYLQYLKGELSKEERHSFERELEADPFEKEALEGLEMFGPAEAEEDLLALHATLRKRLKRRRRIAIYSIAASVASILIVGSIFLNIYQLNPDAAKESLSGDEIFMQDEPETQSTAPVKEELPTEQAAQEKEAAVQKEEIVHEEKAIQAVSSDEKVTAKRAVSEIPVMLDEEVYVSEAAPEMAQAPAPEADELMVMEAEPQKSRKKGREKRMENTVPVPASVLRERVSGVVVSSDDMEPLPGASILVKGRDSGMVTDREGRFSLVADQESQTTVIASYVGMETGEYELSDDRDNQVVMQPDMTSLDEVVVVGYSAENEIKEEIIFRGAEPEGGLEAYKMYMEEQIRFPAGDTISKREVVVLKFNVNADGSISDILTLRSPGDQFSEVAISLLQEGPSWNPARDENGTTDDVVRIRIVFKR